MKRDDINRILSAEDEITPSPAFLASVMDAVAREAATLPPLAFPWARMLPAILAVIAALVVAVVHGVVVLGTPTTGKLLESSIQVATLVERFQLHWVMLGVAAAIFSPVISPILMRERSYA